MLENIKALPSAPTINRSKMPKCLIIETDLEFVKNTKYIVEDLGLSICNVATNFDEIEGALAQDKIDIIISNIKLGDHKFAYDFFNARENMPPIIFLSDMNDMLHYKKCKSSNPYIYLKKPVEDITMRSAIEGALRSNEETLVKGIDMHVSDNNFFIRSNGQMINLDPNKVRYIQSEGNYIYIHTRQKKIAVRSSLKNAMDMMNCENFIQVQRAYMINIKSLTDLTISKNTLTIDNLQIPVGRRYKKHLIQKIKEL